jgi:hypothetical protein
MRTIFIMLSCFVANFLFANDLTILPHSSAQKPAIEYKYFPSRLHAFVFRNWTSVSVERLAKVVDATPTQIEEIASDMGLPPQKKISPLWESPKGYITVVRRNWHLLNYRQLLILTGLDAKTLNHRLIDEDFLLQKLGNFKPICDELKYEKPTSEIKEKSKRVAKILRSAKIETLFDEAEKFTFIKNFANAKGDFIAQKDNDIRIAFSYFSEYADPLMSDKSYPDGLLEELAKKGVNGVWLHVVLNSLVEPMGVFKGSKDAPTRIKNLNNLIKRAEKYGIKIWLYFNEPRGLHDSFFESSPERMALAGAHYPYFNVRTLCTSKPEVLQWLSQATERIFTQAPNLGGVFTITASENPTNCLARTGYDKACNVCEARGRADVIAEVNNTIYRAIKRVSPASELIAWDWRWGKKTFKEILPKLDKGIIVMLVSEIGCEMKRGGANAKIFEYSLSVVGPSADSIECAKFAKDLGIRTMAKVQVNISWEFASTPALPVMNIAGRHSKALRENGIHDFFLSWSLGGYPTPNLELFNRYDINKSLEENLRFIAEKYYGTSQTEKILKAWEIFSSAFEEYPFYIRGLYRAPHNVGVANPIYTEKTNYGATMVGYPYDDLKGWRSIFSEEGYISQMRKVADGFVKGMEIFRSVDTSKMTPTQKADFEKMFIWSDVARIHFVSTVNQAEYLQLRDKSVPFSLKRLAKILDSEELLAKEMISNLKKDAHIGYESSNHYFFTAIDVYEKLLSIDYAR